MDEVPRRPRQLAQASDAQPGVSRQERKQREQAAIEFAQQHHPALVRLLNQLRRIDQREYVKAIRELSRVSERLSNLKQRNPPIYELQLEIWKANSSATLLSARIQLNPDQEGLREELHEVLEKKRTLQRQLLREELDRAKRRVERLEQDIERFDRDKDLLLDREFRKLAPPKTPLPKSGREATDKQDPRPKDRSK